MHAQVYARALAAEVAALGALAALPPADLDADPRRREQAELRLRRALVATRDLWELRLREGRRGSPPGAGSARIADRVAAHGGPEAARALPILAAARAVETGVLDLAALPPERLSERLREVVRRLAAHDLS